MRRLFRWSWQYNYAFQQQKERRMYIFVAMCESLLREECGCCKVTAKHHCLHSFFFNFKAYPSYISSSHLSNSSKLVSREPHTATTKPFFDIFCMWVCALWIIYTGLILRSSATVGAHKPILPLAEMYNWQPMTAATMSYNCLFLWMTLPPACHNSGHLLLLLRAPIHHNLSTSDSFGDA